MLAPLISGFLDVEVLVEHQTPGRLSIGAAFRAMPTGDSAIVLNVPVSVPVEFRTTLGTDVFLTRHTGLRHGLVGNCLQASLQAVDDGDDVVLEHKKQIGIAGPLVLGLP